MMALDTEKLNKLVSFADRMADVILELADYRPDARPACDLVRDYEAFRRGEDATDGEGNTPVVPEVSVLESTEPTDSEVSSVPEK